MNAPRHIKHGERYRGYAVTFNPNAPVTGRWRGVRFGVGLCCRTAEELARCIESRSHDSAIGSAA